VTSTRTWRGITFGGSSDYHIVAEDGLDDLLVEGSVPDLPRYHGGLVHDRLASIKRITLEVWHAGDTPAEGEALAQALRAATIPSRDVRHPYGLVHADGWEGIVYASVARRSQRRDTSTEAVGLYRTVIEFLAEDPAVYSATESSTVVAPFESAAGFTWPAVWPINWGAGGSGGGSSVLLDGSWESWPVYTIAAPTAGTLTNPIIEYVTAGTRLALNANGGVAMTPGQQLIIDTHPARRSINFATGASRYGRLSDDSVWSPFQPGSNEVRFRASGTTTDATLTVAVRAARI
jgi:hypothetical protein